MEMQLNCSCSCKVAQGSFRSGAELSVSFLCLSGPVLPPFAVSVRSKVSRSAEVCDDVNVVT